MNDRMNDGIWNEIKGNWKQFRGEVQKQWGKLTDDDLDQINGERKKLEGRLQERYGETQQEVSRQIDEWAARRKNS